MILLATGALILVFAIAMSASGDRGGQATTTRDPATVAAGADLFAANCAVCHGADLQGTATGPPFLNVIYAPNHHADEAFQHAVAFGVVPHHWNFGPMAPLAQLTRDDVVKIVAFVRTEQEAAGIFRDPSH
jgi:mono/diheme cytochrome c family protein